MQRKLILSVFFVALIASIHACRQPKPQEINDEYKLIVKLVLEQIVNDQFTPQQLAYAMVCGGMWIPDKLINAIIDQISVMCSTSVVPEGSDLWLNCDKIKYVMDKVKVLALQDCATLEESVRHL